MNGTWVDGLSNEAYHNDKENVSSSGLKLLIEESPDVFYDRYVKGNHKQSTDAMNLSSLVHHAVLEGDDFLKRYVVKPKFDLRKNVDKAANAEWMAAHEGKVIVTQEEVEVIEGTYGSIFSHPDAGIILKNCLFERSGYYTDKETGIACRIRYDAYDPRSKILTDIKAVRSAKESQFQWAIKDYRWDLSMAMYQQGIYEIDGEMPEDLVFIAVEKERPYRCAVYQLGARSVAAGFNDYRLALSKLKQCRTNDHWPSLQERLQGIDLPTRYLEEKNV